MIPSNNNNDNNSNHHSNHNHNHNHTSNHTSSHTSNDNDTRSDAPARLLYKGISLNQKLSVPDVSKERDFFKHPSIKSHQQYQHIKP